jgi:hypothetical protein
MKLNSRVLGPLTSLLVAYNAFAMENYKEHADDATIDNIRRLSATFLYSSERRLSVLETLDKHGVVVFEGMIAHDVNESTSQLSPHQAEALLKALLLLRTTSVLETSPVAVPSDRQPMLSPTDVVLQRGVVGAAADEPVEHDVARASTPMTDEQLKETTLSLFKLIERIEGIPLLILDLTDLGIENNDDSAAIKRILNPASEIAGPLYAALHLAIKYDPISEMELTKSLVQDLVKNEGNTYKLLCACYETTQMVRTLLL